MRRRQFKLTIDSRQGEIVRGCWGEPWPIYFFANRHLREDSIVALEPDPICFEELQSNCRKWASLLALG
jgi:hypothetical protein